MRKVEVLDYQPVWKAKFEEEADRLRNVFRGELLDLYHIGSTAIEGMKAKPIIDIMPVVKTLSAVDGYDEQMKSIGYEPKGENGIAGRRFYQKGGENRTFHVHVYEQNNPEIDRHLAFRDYLRSHSCALIQYGELKQSLAKRYPYDIEAYIEGKAPLVQTIEKDALNWKGNRRNTK
ncbi:GrpB family protein [Halobacillus fulvus]|nr:GrpB family protein [Halobacillus fulvus]